MATNVDLGGNTLYVSDIFYGDNTPGNLSGSSLVSTLGGEGQGVSLTAATYTPTTAQNGSTFVFNVASGTTVTLPAPTVGLTYDFIVGTVATSNAQKIITNASGVHISGGIYIDKALAITRYDGDTTTIRSINLNGTTTGGATIGDRITLVGVSSTQWTVSGTVTASGTLATPFATS